MNRTLVVATLLAATAGLAGCGGNGNSPAAQGATVSQPPFGGAGGRGGGFRTLPGAFGVVAAVSATSLEVQNLQTGQTTVSFSGATRFRRTRSAALSDVSVGLCVSASGPQSSGAGPLTARGVEISEPVNGACARRQGGFGGGFGGPGGRPSGFPTARPSGFPSARPSGAPTFGGGSSVVGKVTAVTSSGFTVKGFLRTPERDVSPQPSATPATTTVRVAVNSATTYTRTLKSTRKALKVGLCVAALGKADDTGAVAATSITISTPVNGACFSGFRRRFGSGGSNPAGGSNA